MALLVPVVQFYAWLKIVVDGRRLAWSVPAGEKMFESFKRRQVMVTRIVIVAGVISLLFVVYVPFFARRMLWNFLNDRYSSAPLVAESETTIELTQQDVQTQPLNARQEILRRETCEEISDIDGDGLEAEIEGRIGTDPTKTDSDDDGFADLAELIAGYNPADGSVTEVLLADTDTDGITDRIERNFWHSASSSADTDGDGQTDLEEIRSGTAPAKAGHESIESFLSKLSTEHSAAMIENQCDSL